MDLMTSALALNSNYATSRTSTKKASFDNKQAAKPQFGLNILMVEDDRLCQLIQKNLLESYGCHVDIADSGEQALLMFNTQYDAIVLDINLPGISGLDVSKAIRSHKNGKNIPIFGLSSEAEAKHDECLHAGYSEMLAKPVNAQQLTSLLASYFTTAE